LAVPASLLAGLGDLRQTLAEKAFPPRPTEWGADAFSQAFSRSLLLGLLVLASLPPDGSYLRVVDIARRVELRSGTTYRYLTTLVLAGLVERDDASRRYRRPVAS
jgi:DNA-binding MarR family transcriptional regulator